MENLLPLSKEAFWESLTQRREINEYGTVIWFNADGQLHRDNGPAIEYASGSNAWFMNGFLHREDGPAIEEADGAKEWWLNGNPVDAF